MPRHIKNLNITYILWKLIKIKTVMYKSKSKVAIKIFCSHKNNCLTDISNLPWLYSVTGQLQKMLLCKARSSWKVDPVLAVCYTRDLPQNMLWLTQMSSEALLQLCPSVSVLVAAVDGDEGTVVVEGIQCES